METHYIVQTARAQMPGSCWGSYRRVAVLEVPKGVKEVRQISERDPQVLSVEATWEKCNVGKTPRSAYGKALAEAMEMAAQLNSAKQGHHAFLIRERLDIGGAVPDMDVTVESDADVEYTVIPGQRGGSETERLDPEIQIDRVTRIHDLRVNGVVVARKGQPMDLDEGQIERLAQDIEQQRRER